VLFFNRLHDAERRLAGVAIGVLGAAVIVFPTLYARHSYYAVAVSGAIACLIGVGASAAARARSGSYVFRLGLPIVIATFVVSWQAWTVAFYPADPDHELASAGQVSGATSPTDHVLIIGRDYSPAILFYANRQGIEMPAQASIADLPGDMIARYRLFDCGIDRLGTCHEMAR
jgi:hypothetical protein